MGALTGSSPLPDAPDVAVVIPARDAADTLDGAVASVLSQDVPGGLEIAIAVAPSEDGTAEVVDELAEDDRVHVVANPAGTTPAGLNRAIDATSAPVVVRVDAHSRLPAGYIATAVEALRDAPDIGNVGGRQVPIAADGFAHAVALAMSSPVGSGGATYRHGSQPCDVDTVYLGVFRREALEAVGGFDETLLRNQDYELNHRLRQAGYRVRYLPDLQVSYRPRDTPGGLWRQYHAYGAWKRRVLRRHPGSVRLRQLAAPALVLVLVVTLALVVTTGRWEPLTATVGLYLVAVLAAGLRAAGGYALTGVRVAVALTLMHVAWGVGFLTGRAGSRST